MIRFIFTIVLTILTLNAYSIDYVFSAGVGVTAAWKVNDRIGVFAESDLQTRFNINSVDGADAHQATCQSPGLSLKNQKRYFAISPYSVEYYQNDNVSTALPISYPQLTQNANNDVAHIAASDLMIADVLTTTDNEATFSFNHLGSVMRLCAMVPEDATFTDCQLSTTQGNFLQSGVLNIETANITRSTASQSLSLSLNNITVTRGNKLIVYFILPPSTDLSSGTVTATFGTTDGRSFSCQFSGRSYTAGNAYNVERTILPCESVTFSKARAAGSDETSEARSMRRVAGVVATPYIVAKDFALAHSDVSYDALPPLTGDADNSGSVTNADITATAEYIMGGTPNPFSNKAADANKDGRINVGDITKMSNIIRKR